MCRRCRKKNKACFLTVLIEWLSFDSGFVPILSLFIHFNKCYVQKARAIFGNDMDVFLGTIMDDGKSVAPQAYLRLESTYSSTVLSNDST
jgi:hypothetical protein